MSLRGGCFELAHGKEMGALLDFAQPKPLGLLPSKQSRSERVRRSYPGKSQSWEVSLTRVQKWRTICKNLA